MKRHVFIGLMLLLVLGSCTGTTRKARKMVRRAERLTDTLPDSTLSLIDSVLRMEAYFSERERMELAMLQGDVLFGHHDTAANSIPPLMDDEYFDDKPFFSTSPELERAAAYFARKKQYGRAATAALYSGFVQQHYGENKIAMQSFKDAELYGDMAGDSLAVAMAQYWMGKMLYNDGMEQDALAQFRKSSERFGHRFVERAKALNSMACCHLLNSQIDSAEICFKQGVSYADKSNSYELKRKILNNYSVLFQLQGKYDQAVNCLREIAQEPGLDETKRLLLYLNLGDIYLDFGVMDSAVVYYKHVETLLPNAQTKTETKVSAYSFLSRFAEIQHDDFMALFYWKQYDKWLNEVRDKREQNNVYGIQKKYDYDALQNTMNQKVIRRQRIIIILSVIAIVVLSALVLSQVRLSRIRKQEAEIKASLIRFMHQNEELAKQSESAMKAHQELEQKHQESEKVRQSLANQVEEYRTAYETSDRNLSKVILKQHQIMQKMAVYLDHKSDSDLLDSLKYSVLGGVDYWEAMQNAFDEHFPGMRKKLMQQYPQLTENEQKVLLLSYVDASRNDTALLLDTSVFMVDKLRISVKKKMGENVPKSSKMA